jgi:hypothetical protein
MPALSFQVQFREMIEEGSKCHTVRRRRKKNAIAPGQLLRLYTGMRTKQCKLIKDAVCASVVPIAIFPEIGQIRLDGRLLPLNEMMHFAVRDGFANYMDFFKFFERYPREVRERELEVIYWR